MKTIETKMPFCKSVSRWSTLSLLAFGIFLAARACLVPTALAQSTYEPYTFTTLAGNAGYGNAPGGVVTTLAGVAGSRGSSDGTGAGARFSYPTGAAVDSAGNVYVADTGNSMIRKMTPAGVVTTLAGLAGSPGSADGTGSAARFFYPSGVAVDSAGNVSVADTLNNTIRKVTPAGVVTTMAGLGQFDTNGNPCCVGSADGTGSAAQFRSPSGVAVDSSGNVYVADSGNNTLRKVTPAGVVTTLAGLGGSAVAVDIAGNLCLVVDNSIQKATLTGTNWVVTMLAGAAGEHGSADGTGGAARFYGPTGVAADSAGNVYVADTDNSTIRKVTPAGVVTTLAGLAREDGNVDGTGSAARFAGPSGVAVDSAGNVYVADTGNNTIRKVTRAGVVTTLAGPAPDEFGNSNSGSADGDGSAAQFYGPRGVAADSVGNVYVADSLNATIRKVTPARVVTTLAGLADVGGSADGTGSAARFGEEYEGLFNGRSGPAGVAVDSAGNVYVADTINHTIRNGYPENVAAVIVMSGPGFGFNGGLFGFNLTGPVGRSVVVEASTDLMSWLPLWTNTFAGSLNFNDPQSSVYSSRFYRAHLP